MPSEVTPELLAFIRKQIRPISRKLVEELCVALEEAWENIALQSVQIQSLQAQLHRNANSHNPVFIDSWRNSDGS